MLSKVPRHFDLKKNMFAFLSFLEVWVCHNLVDGIVNEFGGAVV